MKNKLITLFSVLYLLLIVTASCSNSKTYAEKLADERKAINRYIKQNNIKVIDFDDFAANDSVTNVAENEYVELQNKVYLQIIDKGSEVLTDTFANGDELYVRFLEYNIMQKFETSLSNYGGSYPDIFNYRIFGDQISGEFLSGPMAANGFRNVPSGWLIAMRFARKGAHLKVIVPSKMGHQAASSEVYPYFYDLREINEASPGELK